VRENYDIDTLRALVDGTRGIIHAKFGGVHQPQAQLSPQESVALKVRETLTREPSQAAIA
jgi:hypothetical protein